LLKLETKYHRWTQDETVNFKRDSKGKTQGRDFLQFLSVMKSSKQDYLDSIDALKEGKPI
jgi:hypothetical protein